jgi:hypothetical protein
MLEQLVILKLHSKAVKLLFRHVYPGPGGPKTRKNPPENRKTPYRGPRGTYARGPGPGGRAARARGPARRDGIQSLGSRVWPGVQGDPWTPWTRGIETQGDRKSGGSKVRGIKTQGDRNPGGSKLQRTEGQGDRSLKGQTQRVRGIEGQGD